MRWQQLWRVPRDRTAMTGVFIISVFSLVAALAPMVAPHDPNAADVSRKLAPPSADFVLGTDNLGRDILSRLIYGARLSIGIAVVAALGIALLGLFMGLLAGFLGGITDMIVSRVVDVMLAFPTFLMALAITGILGPNLRNAILALVLAWWASYARIVRGAVLAEREKAYVEGARAVGATDSQILRRHVLPNIVAPVIVLTTLDVGAILLGISTLSFLGLGVRPPTAEWGSMLAEGKLYLRQAPYLMLFPGAAIFLAVLGFNLFGDGLRDAMDPRLGAAG